MSGCIKVGVTLSIRFIEGDVDFSKCILNDRLAELPRKEELDDWFLAFLSLDYFYRFLTPKFYSIKSKINDIWLPKKYTGPFFVLMVKTEVYSITSVL